MTSDWEDVTGDPQSQKDLNDGLGGWAWFRGNVQPQKVFATKSSLLMMSQRGHREERERRQADQPGGWQKGAGRGGREGNTHLGPSQPPTAAQLPPEQPVAAVVGLDLGKYPLSSPPLPHS